MRHVANFGIGANNTEMNRSDSIPSKNGLAGKMGLGDTIMKSAENPNGKKSAGGNDGI